MYTLGQAAKATGKSKTSIYNALKKGIISASKNKNGAYQIDASELARVFPIVNTVTFTPSVQLNETEHSEVTGVHAEIIQLREKVQSLTKAQEKSDETIHDLRSRLDSETEERRKLTMLLTDQRATSQTASNKGFLRRLFG